MDKIYPAIKRSFNQKAQNRALLALGVLLLFLSAWLVLVYLQFYNDKFFPKTYIDDLSVSGLKVEEAREKVLQQLNSELDLKHEKLVLSYGEHKVEAELEQLDIQDDLDEVLKKAFAKNHGQSGWEKISSIVSSHLYPQRYVVRLDFAPDKVEVLIQELKKLVDVAGQKPQAQLVGQKIVIDQGLTGTELLVEETWQALHQQVFERNLRDLEPQDFAVTAAADNPIVALEPDQLNQVQQRLEKFLGQRIDFNYDYRKTTLEGQELLNLLQIPEGLNQEKIDEFIQTLKAQVDRPSSDAVFKYNPETLVVEEFKPDQDGLEVDALASQKIIEDFLQQVEGRVDENQKIESSFDLPMAKVKADLTLEESNDLGIKEVIGFGESWYDHSIPNRIFNVDLATSRITNHIVKPNAEFSFNKALGDVSDRSGYRNAYIIEAGQTKLSPGGGVCQVSSTLFRSLLDAGVKISKRLPHAYRVSYYEIGNEPGFDATVYSGEVDLRFINDTPGHVLISCQSDKNTLYMSCKIYGTSDGRSNEIMNYKKWGASPPLPTVYIDTPNLPSGKLEQIDWSASGIKAEFTNVIRDRDGQVIREDYYYSSYRPWAAKYLRGI